MRVRWKAGIAAVATSVAVLAQPMMATAGIPDELAELRAATAPYHRLAVAEAAGYGRLVDQAGIACISDPGGSGSMGIHYVNPALVADGVVDAGQPEVVMYEPTSSGRLRLVGVEHVVFQDQWEEAHPGTVPSLYGHDFELVGPGNRYGLPPFYALHAWVWKNNPSGMFEDWNPRVPC